MLIADWATDRTAEQRLEQRVRELEIEIQRLRSLLQIVAPESPYADAVEQLLQATKN